MTDEQIIKAAGICRTPDTCKGCPYHELYTAECVCTLMKDVFDLISHQKAQIERLKKELEQSEQSGYMFQTILEEKNADISELIFKERDNAVREFADMLKQYADNYGSGDEFIAVSVIDDVMKEMTI